MVNLETGQSFVEQCAAAIAIDEKKSSSAKKKPYNEMRWDTLRSPLQQVTSQFNSMLEKRSAS